MEDYENVFFSFTEIYSELVYSHPTTNSTAELI